MNQLKFKLLTETAHAPSRAYSVDAGLDIYADKDIFIELGSTVKVPTGLAVQIPEGYVGKIEDRSGLASKGLRTGAGVVDAGYTGELQIILHNLTSVQDSEGLADLWNEPLLGYKVKTGDRICQLLLYKIEIPELVQVQEFDSSIRGDKGFNSTGV